MIVIPYPGRAIQQWVPIGTLYDFCRIVGYYQVPIGFGVGFLDLGKKKESKRNFYTSFDRDFKTLLGSPFSLFSGVKMVVDIV